MLISAAAFLTPMHLTAHQAIPWFGSAFAEVILLIVMLKKRLVGRFPFFFASIAYDVCRQAVLFIVLAKFTGAYFAAYWLSIPAEYTFAYAVIYEAFRNAFKADIRFCPNTFKVFGIGTAILILIAASFVFRPSVPFRSLTILVMVLNRSSELLRCSLLLFLWLYSSKLGISWRHHVWGIVFGLGMYSAIGLIVGTVDVAIGKMCGHWLVPIPHYAYFAATIIWPIYLLRTEPARGPLTLQQLYSYRDFIAFGHQATTEIRRLIRERL
ncbi:MAG TPA: hypothetical protein VG649_20525 [Candidatus Angelobacter sp.]|jgi:hypothetical protein|nr:hypothetical protein [Candidatus Angelobacter sp.]